jgi:alpha-beta hydrolase superfamily lysophospholipase
MFLVFGSGCSSLLYYPAREELVNRKEIPIQPVDLEFRSEDGTKLHAWQMKSPKPGLSKCVVLQFHGNGQNLSTHFYNMYWMLAHGFDYISFDYHGYGSSEGEPSPKATVEDGHAALRKIHELYPDKKIVVVAQSLGGNIGLRSVADMKNEIPVAFVFADSTFASYRSVARSTLSHGWLTWLFQPFGWLVMNDEYASKNKIHEIAPTPLVVIHGTADTLVDISMGRDVFDRATEPKEFWEIPGGRHIDSFYRVDIRDRVLAKLKPICSTVP